MNDRFAIMVMKYLDNELEESEIPAFEKFLTEEKNRQYLEDAKIANRIIFDGFRSMSPEDKKKHGLA